MQNYQVRNILRNIPTLNRMPSSRGFDTLLPAADNSTEAEKRQSRKIDQKSVQALAEAVILQSIEDLWSRTNRKKSIEFFTGDGFSICAEVAGMKVVDRLRMFRMLRKLDPRLFDSRHSKKIGSITNGKF